MKGAPKNEARKRRFGPKTHREIGVEVVLPVKKRLSVDAAVESQGRHDGCLHTSFVQDLARHKRP